MTWGAEQQGQYGQQAYPGYEAHPGNQGYGGHQGYQGYPEYGGEDSGYPQHYAQPTPYPQPTPYEDQWPYVPEEPGAFTTAVRPAVDGGEPEAASRADSGTSVPGPPEAAERVGTAEPAPKGRSGSRDRYFDALRAVALVRVVTYHTFGWAWAGMVFPSMGVMFALAGTLMAKSLERPALKVVGSRMRRLLPPFWFWGVFVVVAMMIHGWMPGWQIVFWIVPVGDPPGNQWGVEAWEILWYLRTYLWFVLLSPCS